LAQQTAYKIHIQGLVQGVGFRPFIYRLASQNRLKGWVINRNDGVVVKVMASEDTVEHLVSQIRSLAPAASRIRDIKWELSENEELQDFQIVSSRDASREVTDISPDIAVCSQCLEDMRRQPHRINYPFINCTHCGPRFSIIKDLPYDRPNTTMGEFRMCSRCAEEYEDVDDRRFHAQPVACNRCGPQYEYHQQGRIIRHMGRILPEIQKALHKGGIIAIKGIGGFHLLCDATNESVVRRLRRIKRRDARPFACMFSTLEVVKQYAHVNEAEEQSLLSWRRPIVLLKEKEKLAPSVNRDLDTIGAMLPYMPFHHMLFAEIDLPALVMTSGNISNEPLIIDDKKAYEAFEGRVDDFLFHNRSIHNRTDDSVVRVIDGKERPLRRSRGFAPEPVETGLNVEGLLATGAELKNCFCLGKNRQAVMSQHIGDLKNHEAYDFYAQTVERFLHLFRSEPHGVVCDLHPDYLSTRFARNFVSRRKGNKALGSNGSNRLMQVQHHHAHIASCMAEHGIDEQVIGLAMDGTGYGDDGRIWGGEILVCDLFQYTRAAHLEYVSMPGGDKAIEEPWRMAVAYLYKVYGEGLFSLNMDFMAGMAPEDVKLILAMIRKGINSPQTSSAGRLFDAVSVMLNLCTVSGFDAEAAMKLEAITHDGVIEEYPYEATAHGLCFDDTIRSIISDIEEEVPKSLISSRFHNTLARALTAQAQEIRQKRGLNKVMLSGGTFQNKYLSEATVRLLKEQDFEVYLHRQVPANDGGIALGQLAIASKTMKG